MTPIPPNDSSKRRYCKFPIDAKRDCLKPTISGSDFCDGHKDTWPQNEEPPKQEAQP